MPKGLGFVNSLKEFQNYVKASGSIIKIYLSMYVGTYYSWKYLLSLQSVMSQHEGQFAMKDPKETRYTQVVTSFYQISSVLTLPVCKYDLE